MQTDTNDDFTAGLLVADVVVCAGVGKSGKVAALAADLLQSVGCKAMNMHVTDLMHGGCGVFPMKDLSIVVFFTHSGFTDEVMVAMNYIRSTYPHCRIVFVTSVSNIDGADYVVSYGPVEEQNRHGTVPVQASIAQLEAIGFYVNRIANIAQPQCLMRAHPKGALARAYERMTDGRD